MHHRHKSSYTCSQPRKALFFQASSCPTKDASLCTPSRGSPTPADALLLNSTRNYCRTGSFRPWLRIFMFPLLTGKTFQERAGILLAVVLGYIRGLEGERISERDSRRSCLCCFRTAAKLSPFASARANLSLFIFGLNEPLADFRRAGKTSPRLVVVQERACGRVPEPMIRCGCVLST